MKDPGATVEVEPLEPPEALNRLATIEDLRQALADAASLGFIDSGGPADQARPRRTGRWIAERLCVPGSFHKLHEKWLKSAYRAGFAQRKVDTQLPRGRRRRSLASTGEA